MDNTERQKCAACGSGDTYLSLNGYDSSLVCRSCNAEEHRLAESSSEEQSYCEACDELIADGSTGFDAASVGPVSGRWLCGSCSSLELHTGLRVEKAWKLLGGT